MTPNLEQRLTEDEAREGAALLLKLLAFSAPYDDKHECYLCSVKMGLPHEDDCLYQRGFNWRNKIEAAKGD